MRENPSTHQKSQVRSLCVSAPVWRLKSSIGYETFCDHAKTLRKYERPTSMLSVMLPARSQLPEKFDLKRASPLSKLRQCREQASSNRRLCMPFARTRSTRQSSYRAGKTSYRCSTNRVQRDAASSRSYRSHPDAHSPVPSLLYLA
jgi:hypothetical protein